MTEEKKKFNYAFIDAQNLHLGARAALINLDYGKFRVYLKEKLDIERAYMFIGYMRENQKIYKTLRTDGFMMKYKPVLPPKGNRKQKGDVDADLAFNIMRYYNEYSKAVLITSDGDFDTVVKYLKKKEKLATVISPSRKNCSALLKIASGEKISYMDELGDNIIKSTQNEKAPL